MSEIFLEQKRLSVKCHRNKHEQCKNISKSCGCDCHRMAELQRQLDAASQRPIESHVRRMAYE